MLSLANLQNISICSMQPYPPAVPAMNYNPPSYDAAVAGVGVAQPNSYEKQAPYNPNYNAY